MEVGNWLAGRFAILSMKFISKTFEEKKIKLNLAGDSQCVTAISLLYHSSNALDGTHQTTKFIIYTKKIAVSSEKGFHEQRTSDKQPSRSARRGTARVGRTRTSDLKSMIKSTIQSCFWEILTSRDNRLQINNSKRKWSTIESLGSHLKGGKQKRSHWWQLLFCDNFWSYLWHSHIVTSCYCSQSRSQPSLFSSRKFRNRHCTCPVFYSLSESIYARFTHSKSGLKWPRYYCS